MANNTYIESLRSTLGLSPAADSYWKVQDQDEKEDLFLVHYVTEKIPSLRESDIDTLTRSRIMALRGVIIYLPKTSENTYQSIGTIVTRGFSYTPTCTVSQLFDEKSDTTELIDSTGTKHVLDFAKDSQLKFTTSFDGCVLRVSKWNDKIIMTTAKRLNIEKSFWGQSDYFPEIYKNLKGPDPMSLFSDKPFSNVTHLFMLVHPDLAIASRLNVGRGYIVYLGHQYNNVALGDENLDLGDSYETEPHMDESKVKFYTIKAMNEAGQPCAPYRPPSTEKDLGLSVKPTFLTAKDLNVANIILTVGDSGYQMEDFNNVDQRLTQGESLIVSYTDQHGYGRMIRVSPIAHNWRLAIMNGNFNRYNEFVIDWTYALRLPLDNQHPHPTHPSGSHLGLVFNGAPDKVYTYDQLFPVLATPTRDELQRFQRDVATQIPFVLPCTMPSYFTNEFDKGASPDILMRNIASCFILAAPPNHVIDSMSFYSRFISQREFMMNEFLQNFTKYKALYNNPKDPSKWGLVDREMYKATGEKLSVLTLPKTAEGKDAPQPFSKKEKGGTYALNLAGKRIMDIFTQAIKYADEAERTGRTTKDPKGLPLPRIDILRNNLITLLNREKGMSLYSIMIAVAKSKGVKLEDKTA